jgi:S-adenosyl-L-methionine hydrolase (adenosine-forming)
MADPMVTLTTDFGTSSPYVAAMKGVLLGIDPTIRIVDLSHDIPPQDVRHAAFFLAASLPYFPPSPLHVVVVDPRVGTDRAILYVEVGGNRLLVPDNGCWTFLPDGGRTPLVVRLEEPRYWRKTVSNTFHGRDIFAPVAGHLCMGGDPRFLGPVVTDWVRLPRSEPKRDGNQIVGEVVFVDDFGNLATNIPRDWIDKLPASRRVVIGPLEVTQWVRTYGDAAPGTVVALVASEGRLEVAVTQGNAARKLSVGVGAPVVLRWD